MAFNNKASALCALALVAFVATASVGAQLNTIGPLPIDNSTDATPKPTPITTTTTTAAPTTTTTTVAPTTSTTTAAPTTTPTTTAAPSTSTVAPPAPAPSAPAINKWTFSENNVTCLIVQMAGQLNLTYTTVDDKSVVTLYNLPSGNHTIGGQCGNHTDLLHASIGGKDLLDLEFNHTNDSGHYQLSFLRLQIDASQFANAKPNQTLTLFNVQPQFPTHLDMSYHCTRPQKLSLTASADANATSVADLSVSHLQFEAFHHTRDDHFSTAKDCDSVDTPDIVPIAVGCALAALVALVLIAYLVGRRRRQTRGYLSM